MTLLTADNSRVLWQQVIKSAEDSISVALNHQIEAYLVTLLNKYIDQPELVKQILAEDYLNALQLPQQERMVSLQNVGDSCLLFAGLFPRLAEKRRVKISYFVDLGRTAYSEVSIASYDLYWSLAYQFVVLMDVLQSIRPDYDLSPLEAYEQWQELGSQRALKILQQCTQTIPIQLFKQ